MKVSAAITSTTGTNTPEMVSANRWIGAFEPCASSTRRIILARTVSAPTLVARRCNRPCWLMVAPISGSPATFSTGMLSPVIIASSTDELLNGLVRLPPGTRLQVLAQEDQRNDQGRGVIEGDGTHDVGKERSYYAHHIRCGRADRDQGIHIGATVTQRFDGPAMKLPAHYCPNRGRQDQQEKGLSGEAVHEEHTQDHDR